MLTALEFGFHLATLAKQRSAQPETGRAALSVAEFDQTALPRKDLDRELPTVFASHGPLDAFHDGGGRRSVVLELLGAIGDLHPGFATAILVVGRLVSVLKSPPAGDIVNQDHAVLGRARLDVGDHLLQCPSATDDQTAFRIIRVGLDDLDAAPFGVFAYGL